MQELNIKFNCPHCHHNRVVELRGEVEMRRVVESVLLGNSAPHKHNLLTGEISLTNGTIAGYACQACGCLIKDERDRQKRPIRTAFGLIQWLKRHQMLETNNE